MCTREEGHSVSLTKNPIVHGVRSGATLENYRRWIRSRLHLQRRLISRPLSNGQGGVVDLRDSEPLQVSWRKKTQCRSVHSCIACLTLTEQQRTKYADVKAGLDGYFVKKRNVIFERAKFNQRRQTRDEPVETFITALYSLAEHCEFGALREELIRDRLVVGLRDAKLSEALQMDSDLTLSTAITKSRQSEAVKEQQTVVRNELPLESQKSTELEAAQIRRVKRSLTGQRKSKPAHFQASRVSKKANEHTWKYMPEVRRRNYTR